MRKGLASPSLPPLRNLSRGRRTTGNPLIIKSYLKPMPQENMFNKLARKKNLDNFKLLACLHVTMSFRCRLSINSLNGFFPFFRSRSQWLDNMHDGAKKHQSPDDRIGGHERHRLGHQNAGRQDALVVRIFDFVTRLKSAYNPSNLLNLALKPRPSSLELCA